MMASGAPREILMILFRTFAVSIAPSLLLAGGAWSAAGQEGKKEVAKTEQPVWGKPLKGLRLGVCQEERKARVMVVLENVGTEDFVLYLGDSYAQGKKHWLTYVRLHLVDTDGRKRVLVPTRPKLVDEDGALISHFVIQLVAGGRYAISRDLTDFYDPKDVEAVLPARQYRATVEFVGVAVTKSKNDTGVAIADLARKHFWTGTIQSGECQVTKAAK